VTASTQEVPRPRGWVLRVGAGDRKRPFYFYMWDGEPFAIAGLWEHWEGEGGPLETCTLLTTEANELLASHHDRIPVILRPKD
jgi:putative SOS response-associated peptidase YedK